MASDLAALEAELKRDPGSRRFGDLAREYQRVGRLQEAEALCQKGLARYPNQWQARLLLAQIYVAKGKLQEAREAVDRILMALPDHVAANHLAGDIYYALEERPKALRHYQIVELFEPGRPGVSEKIEELTSPAGGASEALDAVLNVAPAEGPAAAAPIAGDDAGIPGEPAKQPDGAGTPEDIFPSQDAPSLEKAGGSGIDPAGTIKMTAWKEPAATPHQQETVRTVSQLPLEGEPLMEEGGEDLLDTLGDGKELSVLSEESLSSGEALGDNKSAGRTTDVGEAMTGGSGAPEEEEVAPGEVAAAPHVTEVLRPAEPLREEGSSGLNTATLAELYAKQGFPEKAVEIYQRILLSNPENEEVKQRIRGLMRRMDGDAPEIPEVRQEDVRMALRQRRVKLLEGWLRRVRYERHV